MSTRRKRVSVGITIAVVSLTVVLAYIWLYETPHQGAFNRVALGDTDAEVQVVASDLPDDDSPLALPILFTDWEGVVEGQPRRVQLDGPSQPGKVPNVGESFLVGFPPGKHAVRMDG